MIHSSRNSRGAVNLEESTIGKSNVIWQLPSASWNFTIPFSSSHNQSTHSLFLDVNVTHTWHAGRVSVVGEDHDTDFLIPHRLPSFFCSQTQHHFSITSSDNTIYLLRCTYNLEELEWKQCRTSWHALLHCKTDSSVMVGMQMGKMFTEDKHFLRILK